MMILKIGGSVITDKSVYRKANVEAAERIIRTLAEVDDLLCVVHGGGSFGHIKAKEYGLPGPKNETSSLGYSIVHRDMEELDLMIVSLMIENGMKPIAVPVSSLRYDGHFDYSPLLRYIDEGFIPVSYGDVYIKDEHSYGIYSGDDIMADLSELLRPDAAVFLTDVDGIYDKDPKKHKDAVLLREIGTGISFGHVQNDVTGGIAKKFDSMMRMRRYVSGGVYLMNGKHPERIYDIGKGSFIGTVIR
ncbi:kinase [Thermoplasma sp. Kam2015]|uniref:isopentenyl phosphate kinase n=1 Tax=Thermoplasma sp. Kam2015 TaxID=2094122 RepID=UPI000D985F8D|nr:isopentenyl phosphate kinase [Thermoplasma sp. Kam2015]PYB69084.1 kinase [Thermoplasma sp. Kam2015]